MKLPSPRQPLGLLRIRAFTVVELLVAVSIMTLIILVLYGMFDQTQKALRGNTSQVDVLEGGRAAMELMTRELEQMQASGLPGCTNLWVEVAYAPMRQQLVNTNNWRTNVVQEFFFLTPFNKQWSGVGYRVLTQNGVGSLYRFAVSTHVSQFSSNRLSDGWLLFANTNFPNAFQRVADGIVHLRLTAFDALGQPYTWRSNYNNPDIVVQRAQSVSGRVLTEESRYVFRSEALPAYVELEMAILEPHVLERVRSFPQPRMQADYLERHAGAVHLFQQRIPIRVAQ